MKYISVGPLCISAASMNRTGHRQASYPFDWIFSDLDMVKDCIETKFEHFLNRDNIVRTHSDRSTNTHYQHHCVHNIFNHHDLTLPHVHLMYVKRCERFLKDIEEGAFLIYTTQCETYHRDIDRIVSFSCFVKDRFPKSRFVVLLLKNDPGTAGFIANMITTYLCIFTLSDNEAWFKHIMDMLPEAMRTPP